MFNYLIIIKPLGLMYGSAGAFLSPENLVGRSGAKFPPEAATLSGLYFSANYDNPKIKQDLKENLFVAGPFWAKDNEEQQFYVPLPRHRILSKKGVDEWYLNNQGEWQRQTTDIEPDYTWQTITSWQSPLKIIQSQNAEESPWDYIPILHPRMKKTERHTLSQDGLFLENAVQLPEDICLVYLSTHEIEPGWYRFGGENHLVEIKTASIKSKKIINLFQQPIQNALALITPGVWGSTRYSYRYPQHPDFPKPVHLLTDKAIPYRYSAGGKLGRGRYAVPPGTIYYFDQPLNQSWWEWQEEWFPNEGYSLKHLGCGLALPVEIKSVS